MGKEIKNDIAFQHYNTLRVFTENRPGGKLSDTGSRQIDIFENNSPKEFFLRQIKKIEDDEIYQKRFDPDVLRKNWGVNWER